MNQSELKENMCNQHQVWEDADFGERRKAKPK